MGAVRCIFSESKRRFLKLGALCPLNLEGTRKFQASPLRYCLQSDRLYLPEGFSEEQYAYSERLCWARLRVDVIDDLDFDFQFNSEIPEGLTLENLDDQGVGLGARYLKRHRELDGKRLAVTSFCAETLIEGIRKNPEAIISLGKADFQALCAELFVSRGFEVDLYRLRKDGGIDFLAVKSEDQEPTILAVQCKHPDKVESTLSVEVVREIYGVAKAH